MSNVIPSRDPADDGHLAGTLRIAFRKEAMKFDVQLPAKVVSYNRTTNRALVLPLIMAIDTSGRPLQRATIASVPVLALGGGGFCMTFPLVPGDLGWIEASDRDISLFMQSLSLARPNIFRLHNFSDARFVPDAFNRYTFDSADTTAAVIQSFDGTVKISLAPGIIKMKATTVEFDATTINANATNINLNGNVASTGTFTNNGTNISSTHHHGGVTPGGSFTGLPS